MKYGYAPKPTATAAEYGTSVLELQATRSTYLTPETHPKGRVGEIFLGCMDGRHVCAYAMGIPAGYAREYYTPGRFTAGTRALREELGHAIKKTQDEQGNILLVSSFHYSASDEHLGCKAFAYNLHDQMCAMLTQRDWFTRLWGKRANFATIIVGIETDTMDLFFVGENACETHLASDLAVLSDTELSAAMRSLYPSLASVFIDRLCEHVRANTDVRTHVASLGLVGPELDHAESVIHVGTGLTGFAPNTALQIGPWLYNVPRAISIAGSIVHANVVSNRIDCDKGVLLLVTAEAYTWKEGDVMAARHEARELATLAHGVLAEHELCTSKDPEIPFSILVATVLPDSSFQIVDWVSDFKPDHGAFSLPPLRVKEAETTSRKW